MAPPSENNPDGDLRSRLVSVEKETASNIHRITALESWRTLNDIADARKEVEWSGMIKRLDKIDGNVSRVAWILIGSVVMAVMAFIFRGGLNIPPI